MTKRDPILEPFLTNFYCGGGANDEKGSNIRAFFNKFLLWGGGANDEKGSNIR